MCSATAGEGRKYAADAQQGEAPTSGDVSVQKSRLSHAYSAHFSKYLLWWTGCLLSVGSTGILFGYTAIAVALKKQGEYSELCKDDDDKHDGCKEIDLQFSLIYTIASSLFFMSYLLHGPVLDKCGPKISIVAASFFVFAGAIIIAFSDSQGFDGYIFGFCMMGLGGPGVHLALFHLTNLFERKALAQSALVGVFVCSGFVFVIFGLVFRETTASRRTVFLALAGWLLFFTLLAARLTPSKQFKRHESIRFTSLMTLSYVVIPPPSSESGVEEAGLELTEVEGMQHNASHVTAQGASSMSESSRNREVVWQISMGTEPRQSSFHRPPDLSALSMREQMRAQEYLLLLVFMCCHVLHFNFYIGSSVQQLDNLGDRGLYKMLLTLILPAGCALVLFVGNIMQRFGLAAAFLFCNTFGLFYGVLSAVPLLEVQVATFICLSIHRVAMFACLYTYIADIFGFINFGSLSGITLLIAAVFSLLQYPLIIITDRLAGGDFFWVNVALTVPTIFLFYVPVQIVRLSAAAAIMPARLSMYPLK